MLTDVSRFGHSTRFSRSVMLFYFDCALGLICTLQKTASITQKVTSRPIMTRPLRRNAVLANHIAVNLPTNLTELQTQHSSLSNTDPFIL